MLGDGELMQALKRAHTFGLATGGEGIPTGDATAFLGLGDATAFLGLLREGSFSCPVGGPRAKLPGRSRRRGSEVALLLLRVTREPSVVDMGAPCFHSAVFCVGVRRDLRTDDTGLPAFDAVGTGAATGVVLTVFNMPNVLGSS